MEFRYSEQVCPGLYETHGLADGISLRQHTDPHKEICGALRAHQDWSKYIKPVPGYRGGLGSPLSFIRVTVPECLPERLEIISYANEYAFLYDDAMEKLDLRGGPDQNATSILETFRTDILKRDVGLKTSPEKKLQAQILSEMMALDPDRAITTMKAWATFVQLASKTRSEPFDTLASYVPARVIDAGELIWFGTLTFAMALTISGEEYDECMRLARPGYAVLGLTNDLYSWEKEKQDAARANEDHVFNAVWVIMQERNVTEHEAKDICAEEIKKYVSEYTAVVDKARNDMMLSRDLRAYLEAVMYSCSGNLAWSINCPRYHEL